MTAELIIANAMARRAANGLHMVVEFDNRSPFNFFAANKADFDRAFANFTSRIGKVDEAGSTIVSVRA